MARVEGGGLHRSAGRRGIDGDGGCARAQPAQTLQEHGLVDVHDRAVDGHRGRNRAPPYFPPREVGADRRDRLWVARQRHVAQGVMRSQEHGPRRGRQISLRLRAAHAHGDRAAPAETAREDMSRAARDGHRVLERQRARHERGSELSTAGARHGVGPNATGAPELGHRDLQRRHRRLELRLREWPPVEVAVAGHPGQKRPSEPVADHVVAGPQDLLEPCPLIEPLADPPRGRGSRGKEEGEHGRGLWFARRRTQNDFC